MQDPDVLKRIVAELFQTPPQAIGAEFSLRHPRFQSSAGRGVLAAAIQRQLGVYSAKAFTASRYGELEAAIFGAAVSSSAPAVNGEQAVQATPPAPPVDQGIVVPGVRVGVDIEMVESMPDVPDFWADPFYQTHFTPAEIAYCLRQEQPRVHFAARWCAKEALIKCDPRFAGVDPTTVQVARQPDGQPVLEVLNGKGTHRIDFALSLSHTPAMAIAVVAAAAPTPKVP